MSPDEQRARDEELERRVDERTAVVTRAKREWESTFDAIVEPIALQDGYVIRRANLEYARRSAVRVQQLIGRRCFEMLAERSEPCVGCPLSNSRGASGEVQARGRKLAVSAFAIGRERELPPSVLSYRDVTEQRDLEARLKQTEQLVSVGQLASGAAHEINNPMAFLMSNVVTLQDELREKRELLVKQGLDADEWLTMLAETMEGARRITDIVRHLQLLAGPASVAYERVVVNEPVVRAIEQVLSRSSAAKVELTARQVLHTDPVRLQQALEHVIRNAKQAVGDVAAITLSTYDVEGGVVVRVEDRGEGIADEVLPHVFEPFFTTRRVGAGAGLGLTATWGIVHQLGGQVTIASKKGEGTQVEIRLPLSSPPVPRGVPRVGRYGFTSRTGKP